MTDYNFLMKRIILCMTLLVMLNTSSLSFAEGKVLKIDWHENRDSIFGILSEADFDTEVKGKHGVAIICHGFNGTHHFGLNYVEPLKKLGYAVYTFDFPSGSMKSKSDNNTLNMSILDEKEALERVMDYFLADETVDPERLVVIGESQGGLVAALAASETGDKINKLILVYPALCIPDNWNARYPRLEDIPDKTEVWKVPLGSRFFEEIHDMNPYNEIKSFKNPVLIVHGSEDVIVPLEYSRRAAGIYDNVVLKVLEGEGHGFSEKGRELSNQYVVEFLTD